MICLITFCAIAMFLLRHYREGDGRPDRYVMFGVYLGFLATATVAPFSSPPLWKRFWLTYAVFGWSYLVLVLRIADPLTDRILPLWHKTPSISGVGIMCGFFCAFLSLVLPGPVLRNEPHDNKLPPAEN
jgi:hypothetical protein